jgi:phosphatidylserine decarboxylase
MLDKLFTLPQYCLPQHFLSRLLGKLTTCQVRPVKNLLIKLAIWKYKIDVTEAADTDSEHYAHFNAFFTRALKPGVRPLPSQSNAIASPADGNISQCGAIHKGRIFQAKGRDFSTLELLGGQTNWHHHFDHGQFITVYLSPRDYHRVHMPYTGKLIGMTYVPGKLFSVNPRTANTVNNLFARNERVVCLFETDMGPMAVVLVGAFFVASMETVWHGLVAPSPHKKSYHWNYHNANHVYKTGDEIGRFQFGSTVIVLFGKDAIEWAPTITSNRPVQMGELIGVAKQQQAI